MISLAVAVMVSTGAVNPACTMDDVCQPGYTRTVRPPSGYTTRLKVKQLKTRNPHVLASFEEDHFIPLELCGCSACPENLWPEPWSEAHKKDRDETRLHRAVCRGEMTLEQAQDEIKRRWRIHD